MKEFSLCDIVVVTTDHPIGIQSIKTKGDVGMIVEVGLTGPHKCYRVQNSARGQKEGFFYAGDEIRKATASDIAQEFKRLMLGN